MKPLPQTSKHERVAAQLREGWAEPREFLAIRERVRENKNAVGRRLIDVEGYTLRVFVTKIAKVTGPNSGAPASNSTLRNSRTTCRPRAFACGTSMPPRARSWRCASPATGWVSISTQARRSCLQRLLNPTHPSHPSRQSATPHGRRQCWLLDIEVTLDPAPFSCLAAFLIPSLRINLERWYDSFWFRLRRVGIRGGCPTGCQDKRAGPPVRTSGPAGSRRKPIKLR